VAAGGTAPYSFTISAGALPAGLALSANGVLSGTPTEGGSFTFTVQATDASTFASTQNYGFTATAPTFAFGPASLATPQVGASYSDNIAATGATAPYTLTISAGTLPAGLTLAADGTLGGTPTEGGSFSFTVQATDSSTGTGP